MSSVTESITIAAPPAAVWKVALDPWRLGDWVTIHRQVHEAPKRKTREGDTIVQTMALRGAPFKVTWTLAELDEPHRAVWRGRGPAGSVATTVYELTAAGKGTRFDYTNEFVPPGGLVGRVAANALVGGLPRSEARASLERLKALLEEQQG